MIPQPHTAAAMALAVGTVLAAAHCANGQLLQDPMHRRAVPVVPPPTDTPSSGGDFEIAWMTTDGGGVAAAGGDNDVIGTFGQHDAGSMTGDCYQVASGFWAIVAPPSCYANCDLSTQTPVLNVADFTCFLTRYANGECYANCDSSTQAPILNVADFTCFLQKYALGCP